MTRRKFNLVRQRGRPSRFDQQFDGRLRPSHGVHTQGARTSLSPTMNACAVCSTFQFLDAALV